MSSNAIELITPKDLLFTKSPLTAEQMQIFYQLTPADKIYERKGKGGETWKYVKTAYVIETLNRVSGYLWNFEKKLVTDINNVANVRETGSIIVEGRLSVKVGDVVIVKEQFGRADVKFLSKWDDTLKKKVPTNKFLDLGNDCKAATSDALKKCASEFGLFRDVYSPDDFIEATVISDEDKQQLEDAEIENAKELLRGAENIEALRQAFVSLSPKIRNNKAVIASKNALKRKLMKGEME